MDTQKETGSRIGQGGTFFKVMRNILRNWDMPKESKLMSEESEGTYMSYYVPVVTYAGTWTMTLLGNVLK